MTHRAGLTKPPIKRTSVVRRIPPIAHIRHRASPGLEGDVCLFELAAESAPIVVEADSGRPMTLLPGDRFLAVPGYRESTRWVVGGIPHGGLLPGHDYWVLADCGVVGELIGNSPLQKGHLAPATYLGVITGARGKSLNIRQFVETAGARATDRRAPLFLVLGTSSEVGKTTAVVAVLRALRQSGHSTLVALKATGTSSIAEIAQYLDHGATHVFDCVDFGLPTTYPSDRRGMDAFFDAALGRCLALPAHAVVVECGGDLFGANVPALLACLMRRRAKPKVLLVAPDALAALGAKQALRDLGISIDLITGPCTDTPTLLERTRTLCKIPAINMMQWGGRALPI
ncbi:MAG TPA: hypothetical protein VMB81_31850 [Candidatus Sulfotelmatobacter sp.]|nr:hypothetical protein [Candidatus Sulfotelmatobacter sp.]